MSDKYQQEGTHNKREYILTVGNIEKSMATLVDLDYNVVQLPRYLLSNATPGQVIRMILIRDKEQQQRRLDSLNKLSNDLQSRKMAESSMILRND